MKTEFELRQMFKNFSDCYADTWELGNHKGTMKEGKVIQAITEEKFIEMMKQANFISSNSMLADEFCVCPVSHAKGDNWCPCCGKKLRK